MNVLDNCIESKVVGDRFIPTRARGENKEFKM